MKKQSSETTKKFLEQLYKNVKMGADSIVDIMPKVEDSELKLELTSELEMYEKFATDIKAELDELGTYPEEENVMIKTMSKMGLWFNTLTDTSKSHIADIMIQGATMGITDTTKLIREHENTDCSESALAIARKTVKYEEETIERLKSFL